jgi:hypothetical protein
MRRHLRGSEPRDRLRHDGLYRMRDRRGRLSSLQRNSVRFRLQLGLHTIGNDVHSDWRRWRAGIVHELGA